MKEKATQLWIPLYVDKWIFGSTRIELEPDERGVFVDLMVLAAKDSGYIRANEITPYPPRQLAGLLNIPEELLLRCLKKCIEFTKVTEVTPGIYRLTNWDEYQLSKSYISELESGKKPMPGMGLRTFSSPERTKGSTRREDKRRENILPSPKGFDDFWLAYPRKTGKDAAAKAWAVKKPDLQVCLKALVWQVRQPQWVKDSGQFIPHPATWLNQARWLDEPEHKLRPASPLPTFKPDTWKPEYDFDITKEKK